MKIKDGEQERHIQILFSKEYVKYKHYPPETIRDEVQYHCTDVSRSTSYRWRKAVTELFDAVCVTVSRLCSISAEEARRRLKEELRKSENWLYRLFELAFSTALEEIFRIFETAGHIRKAIICHGTYISCAHYVKTGGKDP